MSVAFDHLVVLVHDLEATARDYERLGFTLSERHDAMVTGVANRFVSFADGSYLLLSALGDPASPGAKAYRLAPFLAEGEGLVDYAYVVDDVRAAAARLRAAGLPAKGPLRTIGALIGGGAWSLDLLLTGKGSGGEDALPFLVSDVEGRSHRIPPASVHRNGATGIAGVRLRAASAASIVRALASMTGEELEPDASTAGAKSRYRLGSTWLEIVEDGAIAPGHGRLVEAVLTTDGSGVRPDPALLRRAAIAFS
ncbi:VOC family protein [Antarcticirhabdus aurantiaca]|uniref:VOC family protein n=1 Tax=Antarcticirhabdus aurantiaca TaxID=2606717 RepID=A0ACD4NNQ1_9HYPH|nr:VOC family protein [Antarcticirhabdus aurantiaca]WAJ28451.1 VOC family protein [Jeongeuplla avenae]